MRKSNSTAIATTTNNKAGSRKSKMVPIANKDYSCRLKEMQQRLEKAKIDYGSSSRSPTPNQRSRSPAARRTSRSPFATDRSSITPTRNRDIARHKAKTVIGKIPQNSQRSGGNHSNRKSARLFKTQSQLQDAINRNQS